MAAVLLLLLDLVKYVRMRARVCVRRAPIPPRAYVYDLYMLLLLLLLLLLLDLVKYVRMRARVVGS